jgi:hypothetical protein
MLISSKRRLSPILRDIFNVWSKLIIDEKIKGKDKKCYLSVTIKSK